VRARRSVNRKVQGSNPWSGAILQLKLASSHLSLGCRDGNRWQLLLTLLGLRMTVFERRAMPGIETLIGERG
jgi:hypothetical protein